ncbi:response regulator [Flavobacterium sp. K5-23]|uniref:response regulator n=1 Tax=Flavobacterium sp. K5-23 TaxID=2746225 RepID=UPI002010A5CA|nr:response regulator [Flavobacterium sp. K5-23]UQD56514.1 response regulator [Flavobacterium sp. K5-23]
MLSTNVLLVDNCKTDIDKIKKAFSENCIHFNLNISENVSEAWLLLQGKSKLSPTPKIMLIDINEQGIDGLDLIRKIRKNPFLKSILIYVITSTDNDINKIAAFDLNVAGYLHKPDDEEKWDAFFSILNDYWSIIKYSN